LGPGKEQQFKRAKGFSNDKSSDKRHLKLQEGFGTSNLTAFYAGVFKKAISLISPMKRTSRIYKFI